ncbi:enoyl-CoA hydratase/isomerase family protein [Micromonospora sp. CPCC 206060]|uniref:enoyl-CoA hydratase/isomerase family protein n=1 Tax=Micromonospora sp. CPCC 206060 TaxID=3122406 RepID=UPI002FF001BD
MPSQQVVPGLTVEVSGPVATVVINNPARRNALTPAMWRQLPPLLDGLETDPGVRVVVLTGAGDTFCAGADLTDLDELLDAGDGSIAVAAEERLATFTKPTIAAVRGACMGGGCQLAVACDLRIAAADARFGVPPARLGVVYPAPTTRRLVALVGPGAAKYLLFTADPVGADRAARIGLVDEVVPAADLAGRVRVLADTISTRSQLSVTAAKEIIGMVTAGRVDPERVAHWHRLVRTSGEAREGVAAFAERRPARFRWTPPLAD